MNNRQLVRGLLYGVLILLLSCIQYPKPDTTDSPVIARVGNTVLTVKDLNKSIPSEYSDDISQRQRINYVKQWLDREFLFQAAKIQKIHKEEEMQSRFARMKKDLLVAEMISRNSSTSDNLKISEESIHNYYEQHKGQFIRESDAVKYVEIIVKGMKSGWKIRNMITNDNFLEVAAQYSEAPVPKLKTLPFILLKDIPIKISEVISKIRIKGITAPILMLDGVHIIYVLDKQIAGDTCLIEEVNGEIISTLSAQIQKKVTEDLLAELRQKIDYEFHLELLSDNKKITNDQD